MGKRHSLTDQAPEKQPAKDSGEEERSAQLPEKPDFDQKDQNISPNRKAPGPGKTSRPSSKRQPGPEAGESADEDSPAPPEAVIGEGAKGNKGKNR